MQRDIAQYNVFYILDVKRGFTLKETVHPEKQNLSFTHPCVVLNKCNFLYFVESKIF